MKKFLFVLILLIPSLAAAGKWVPLTGYSLSEVYNTESTKVIGSSGLSWPDGRQANVILMESYQSGKRWLYRCVDYFNADMKPTGQDCFYLSD